MRARRSLLLFNTLVVGLLCGSAGAEETLDDFVVAGADPFFDFRPLSGVEVLGSLAFVAGIAPDPILGIVEPAVVALRARDGSEAWRASEPDFDAGFSSASADAGRVCAAGLERQGSLPVTERLLVACYDAARGARLWSRRLELDATLFRSSTQASIRVEQGAVWVRLQAVSFAFQRDLLLRFDARDGSAR